MPLPERTLCWVEGPPHDRTCTPVNAMPPDLELLRLQMAYASHTEAGQVIATVLASLMTRGIDLRSFMPNLVDAILNDKEMTNGLDKIAKRQ